MDWNHMSDWGWQMMLFWGLLWVVLIGVGLWGIVFWTRGHNAPASPAQPAPRDKTARELLDERLARGEIDLREYQTLREALEPRAPTAA
jgi:putative membrane protein